MTAIEAVAPRIRALTSFTFNRGLEQADNIVIVIHDERAMAVGFRSARPTLFVQLNPLDFIEHF